MKKIYIILTYTGTLPARIVRFWTRTEYSHVSIALDKNLTKMYSFSRLANYNFFIAGFLHENIHKGIFKRFKNTYAKIGCLEITDQQYEKMEQILTKMEQEKHKYKFNMIGFLLVTIKRKRVKKNYFYCAEFVKYIFEQTGINLNLPDIIIPTHFKNIENLKFIYEGKLQEYNI